MWYLLCVRVCVCLLFSYLLGTCLKDETGRCSLVIYDHYQDTVIWAQAPRFFNNDLQSCPRPFTLNPPMRKMPLTTSCLSGLCVSVCTRLERVWERFSRAWLQWALWVRRHCSTRSDSLCTSSKRRCSSSSKASRAALTWASTCSLALFAAVCTKSRGEKKYSPKYSTELHNHYDSWPILTFMNVYNKFVISWLHIKMDDVTALQSEANTSWSPPGCEIQYRS